MPIRKATQHDAHALWQLRIDAILAQCADFYPPDLLAIWTFGEPGDGYADLVARQFYVLELAGRVVASGAIDLADGAVDAIFVAPDQFGHGHGAQMMAYLEALARAAQVPQLHLRATLNAAPFYRRCGFVGDAVGQYHSPRGIVLDCVPMQKTLV
jgi:N-acetylglutamate synthase-like GNAT family acetyltransferase